MQPQQPFVIETGSGTQRDINNTSQSQNDKTEIVEVKARDKEVVGNYTSGENTTVAHGDDECRETLQKVHDKDDWAAETLNTVLNTRIIASETDTENIQNTMTELGMTGGLENKTNGVTRPDKNANNQKESDTQRNGGQESKRRQHTSSEVSKEVNQGNSVDKQRAKRSSSSSMLKLEARPWPTPKTHQVVKGKSHGGKGHDSQMVVLKPRDEVTRRSSKWAPSTDRFKKIFLLNKPSDVGQKYNTIDQDIHRRGIPSQEICYQKDSEGNLFAVSPESTLRTREWVARHSMKAEKSTVASAWSDGPRKTKPIIIHANSNLKS